MMIRKVFLLFVFTAVSLFAMNFQTASKEELMSIKGIGEKRAAAIMKYRRTHKIKSAADLKNIPGIGDEIANNAAKGIKNADKKVTRARKSVKKAKSRTTALKEKAKKRKSTAKEKSLKKVKAKKSKTEKKAKKTAGDKTKRAEKRAKTKAKKSLKKVKAKKKK